MRLIVPEQLRPGIQFICTLLVALLQLILAQSAPGQSCDNTMSVALFTSPISGSKVLIGQTVTIQQVLFYVGDPGSCLMRNGDGYLLYPDGTTAQVVTNLNLNPPGEPPVSSMMSCYGTNFVAADGQALAFSTTWVVQPSDIGKSNAFVMPPRGDYPFGITIPFAGIPGRVYFGASAVSDGFLPGSPTVTTGSAVAFATAFLTIANPLISVTMSCDYPAGGCGGTNFAFGDQVAFKGTVCNVGDVGLANISVMNTPSALVSSQSPIAFSAVTSSGNPFTPATGLTNGECVNFSGTYQPSDNLAGPFLNTVVASAIASGVAGNPVVSATNSAFCAVCGPQITNLKLVGSDLVISGSGGKSNTSYTAIATTNLGIPLTNWTPVYTDRFDLSGQFAFTNRVNATKMREYFRLRIP
jgi:hypothetical protein